MTLPFPRHDAGARLRSALVERISNGIYFVADSYSLIPADRSPGCLLQPEKDDLVLILEDRKGTASIVMVLEREAGKPALLSVDGDAVIKGEGSISFTSGCGINLLTPHLRLKAWLSKITIADCAFSGAFFTSCGRRLQTVCADAEIKAHKMVEQIRRLYRRIQDEDSQLGSVHYHVQDRFSIRAQDASVAAEKGMQVNSSTIEAG
jgi:hypothetical protein